MMFVSSVGIPSRTDLKPDIKYRSYELKHKDCVRRLFDCMFSDESRHVIEQDIAFSSLKDKKANVLNQMGIGLLSVNSGLFLNWPSYFVIVRGKNVRICMNGYC